MATIVEVAPPAPFIPGWVRMNSVISYTLPATAIHALSRVACRLTSSRLNTCMAPSRSLLKHAVAEYTEARYQDIRKGAEFEARQGIITASARGVAEARKASGRTSQRAERADIRGRSRPSSGIVREGPANRDAVIRLSFVATLAKSRCGGGKPHPTSSAVYFEGEQGRSACHFDSVSCDSNKINSLSFRTYPLFIRFLMV